MLSVIFWALFVWVAELGIFAFVAVIVAALMLRFEHHIVRKDFTKIDMAFFTVNGYLGFAFFILIVLDKIVS